MTDLDKEFQQLVGFLRGFEPEKVGIDEIFRKSVVFFEKMQATIEKLTTEQKREIPAKLLDLFQKLTVATKVFIDAVGLSENDLFALMEKPGHFNQEQWKLMQESKRQITECAKKIGDALSAIEPAAIEKVEQHVAKKETKKPPSPPRSSWMKS